MSAILKDLSFHFLSINFSALKNAPKIQSPKRKVPSCTVPQPTEQPDNEHIKAPSQNAHPVAVQWDIKVIAEPTAQRHVPSAPELRDTF